MANPAPHGVRDSERLQDIYREHFDFVWRCLGRFNLPESEREDMAQEVFIVVMRRLDDFGHRSSVQTWLYAIIRNIVRARGRTNRRHRRKLAALRLAWSEEPHYDPVDQRDKRRLLHRLLSELDEQKQDIYILTQLEGLTFAEIAQEVGVEEGTLRSRLHAAKKQLVEAAELHLRNEGRR